MKSSVLRDMSISELDLKSADLEKELFNVKFQLHTGKLENSAKVSALKKDIARVKTILREKRG